MNITTPVGILSYPNLWTPKRPKGVVDGKPKYSCNIIFPEGTDVSEIQEQFKQACIDEWGSNVPTFENDRKCLRKGKDVKGTPDQYAECWVLLCKASEEDQPAVKYNDAKKTNITKPSDIYAGCKVMGRVGIFAYRTGGKPGVGAGLNGILKVGDGEHLDNRESEDEMFADVAPTEGAGPSTTQAGGEAGADAGTDSPDAKEPWE